MENNLKNKIYDFIIENHKNLSQKELHELTQKHFNIDINFNTFKGYIRKSGCSKSFLPKSEKEQICKYIKLQHRQTCQWLQEHIKSKFKIIIPLATIRTWKRQNDALTNRKSIKRQWISYIRNNYKNKTDKQIAEILKNKFQRDVSYHTVKHIRGKYHFYKPKIKNGLTIKEIRICPNCGKKIKITCRNPHQKFCCHKCVGAYTQKQNHKRNMSVITPDKIATFLQEWTQFIKKVIWDKRYTLNSLDRDEVFTDVIAQIPSIMFQFEKQKVTRGQHQRNYIAGCVKNQIYKKLSKKISWEENTYTIERMLEMNKV